MLYHCLWRWPNIKTRLMYVSCLLELQLLFKRFLLAQVGYLHTCASRLLAHLRTCESTCESTCAGTCSLVQVLAQVLSHLGKYLRTSTLTHWAFVLLNRQIFVCQMEAHKVCLVNTLTWLSVGLMLYHCPRRRPNIKTTLCRRFVLDGITTVILIVKCSTLKVTTVHSKYSRFTFKQMIGIRLKDWPCIETASDKCNSIIKSSI